MMMAKVVSMMVRMMVMVKILVKGGSTKVRMERMLSRLRSCAITTKLGRPQPFPASHSLLSSILPQWALSIWYSLLCLLFILATNLTDQIPNIEGVCQHKNWEAHHLKSKTDHFQYLPYWVSGIVRQGWSAEFRSIVSLKHASLFRGQLLASKLFAHCASHSQRLSLKCLEVIIILPFSEAGLQNVSRDRGRRL